MCAWIGQFITSKCGKEMALQQNQTGLNPYRDGFRARPSSQLAQDRSNVKLSRMLRNVEARGDFLVRESRSQHLKNFALAWSKSFRRLAQYRWRCGNDVCERRNLIRRNRHKAVRGSNYSGGDLLCRAFSGEQSSRSHP